MYGKPHGHNLVFVGTEFVKDTSATAIEALTQGQVGLYLPDGQGINTDPTSGNSVAESAFIVAMGTGKTDFNGNPLPFKSFKVDKNNIVTPYPTNRDYAAAVQQETTITLTTITVGEKVIVGARINGLGSYSKLNYTHIYGEADVASGDDQEAVVDKLVISFNQNADILKVPTITASKTGAGAAAELVLTAQAQSTINFENPLRMLTFDAYAKTATQDAVVAVTAGPKPPVGYGLEVANYENFHLGGGAQWQYKIAPYQKPRDLQTDVSLNYDCVDVVINETKKNNGSNISLDRKISIYIDQAATTGAPPALDSSAEDLRIAMERILYGYTKP